MRCPTAWHCSTWLGIMAEARRHRDHLIVAPGRYWRLVPVHPSITGDQPRRRPMALSGRSFLRRTTCRGSIHLLSPSIGGGAARIGLIVEGYPVSRWCTDIPQVANWADGKVDTETVRWLSDAGEIHAVQVQRKPPPQDPQAWLWWQGRAGIRAVLRHRRERVLQSLPVIVARAMVRRLSPPDPAPALRRPLPPPFPPARQAGW